MGVTKEITKPAPAGAAKPVKGQKPFPPFFFFLCFCFKKRPDGHCSLHRICQGHREEVLVNERSRADCVFVLHW